MHEDEDLAALASASYTDLAFEWSMLCQDCVNCWTETGRNRLCFQDVKITFDPISRNRICCDLLKNLFLEKLRYIITDKNLNGF